MEEFETEIITLDFKEKVRRFNSDFYQKYKDISKEPTPEVDGTGQKIIEQRGDGLDYIIESYMRDCLDRHFPGWSWEAAAPLHFLGADWVVAQGHLGIIDEHLLAFGIRPPIRKFYGVDSVRIQYKSGVPHSPATIIDVGDNCKQANTAALKYAINRLTRIGDDVYGKRIEEQGAGTFTDVFEGNPDADNFSRMVNKELRITWGKVFEILKVKDATEITDYKQAIIDIKKALGRS